MQFTKPCNSSAIQKFENFKAEDLMLPIESKFASILKLENGEPVHSNFLQEFSENSSNLSNLALLTYFKNKPPEQRAIYPLFSGACESYFQSVTLGMYDILVTDLSPENTKIKSSVFEKLLRSRDNDLLSKLTIKRLSAIIEGLNEKNCFAGLDLTNIDLTGLNLSRLNLSDVILKNATLFDADLTETDLSNAKLNGANLMFAKLNGSDLCRADLTDAILTHAVYDQDTNFNYTQWTDQNAKGQLIFKRKANAKEKCVIS